MPGTIILEIVRLKNISKLESYILQKMDLSQIMKALNDYLRNCSREAEGKDSMYVILVKGEWAAIKHRFFF